LSDSPPDRSTAAPAIADQAAALRALLASRPPVTALCHENPDGDTIGAAAAMALAARKLGCDVELVMGAPPPAYEKLLAGLDVRPAPGLAPGVAIVCDSASLDRVGGVLRDCPDWFAASTIVNVDHHVTNDGFGSINLVDPRAAASCEVVAETLPHLGVEMDAPIASAILAGIIRDSNGFSTASTRPGTLRAAAAAVEAGADLEWIYRSAVLEMPLGAVDLWGRLLSELRRDAGGRIVWTLLRPGHLEATGTDQHDAEGVAEFLMRGGGVDIGILFRDLGDSTRVSLRTSAAVDASALATAIGGGGHARRAGSIIARPAPEAIELVLERCRAALG
jgi:phosphoesterase RecJ-like protein